MIDVDLLNELATVTRLPATPSPDDYGNMDNDYEPLTSGVPVRVELGRSQLQLVVEPLIGRGWSTIWLGVSSAYVPQEYDRLTVPNSGVHQVAKVILWSGIDDPDHHYELVCELVT